MIPPDREKPAATRSRSSATRRRLMPAKHTRPAHPPAVLPPGETPALSIAIAPDPSFVSLQQLPFFQSPLLPFSTLAFVLCAFVLCASLLITGAYSTWPPANFYSASSILLFPISRSRATAILHFPVQPGFGHAPIPLYSRR